MHTDSNSVMQLVIYSLRQLRVRGKKGKISHKAKNWAQDPRSIVEFQPPGYSSRQWPFALPLLMYRSWVGCHAAPKAPSHQGQVWGDGKVSPFPLLVCMLVMVSDFLSCCDYMPKDSSEGFWLQSAHDQFMRRGRAAGISSNVLLLN